MAAAARQLGGAGELDRLVSDLEEDQGVQQGLDGLPLPSAGAGATVVYRDADDVLTINRSTWAIMFLALSLTLSLVGNLVMYVRKASLVVIDRTTGQTLVVNDREYGKTPAAEVTEDQPLESQKLFIVKEFLRGVYEFNQSNRQETINRAIRMMHPDSSIQYVKWLKHNQVLETQEAEGWQARWEVDEKNITVDPRDSQIVTVVGEQTVRRMKDGQLKQAKITLSIKVLVMESPTKPKRNDNNLQTGFCVVKFKPKALNSEETPFLLMNDGQQQ
ncbi:MAG: VirB8/TrbF family protein [Pyrinomonadaceae bacterium]